MSSSYKLVLLGEGRSGKTSLTVRFVNGSFNDGQPSTIQATYLSKRIELNSTPVTLAIWDTAGQERFHALGPIYYRDADGALLVFDITDLDSFEKAKKWVKELRQFVGSIPITIAGNKKDLERSRAVEESTAKDFAESVKAVYIETSAKTGENVEDAFRSLAEKMVAQSEAPSTSSSSTSTSNAARRNKNTITISYDTPAPQSSGCSC
ncbi:hypothetical protein P9112_012253 [Eukaryota sp. TZLM1-RC]